MSFVILDRNLRRCQSYYQISIISCYLLLPLRNTLKMVPPLFPLREDHDRLRNLRVLISRNKINVDKVITAVIHIGNETNQLNNYVKEIRKNIDLVDYKINKMYKLFTITLDQLAEEENYQYINDKEIQNIRFKFNRIERQFYNYRKYSQILFLTLITIIIIMFIIIAIKI